jgi:hypothetical protein
VITLWNVQKNKTKNNTAIARIHVNEKENAATAFITIEKWDNYLLVFSQRILKKHMIEALNDSSKSTKNEDAGGNPFNPLSSIIFIHFFLFGVIT